MKKIIVTLLVTTFVAGSACAQSTTAPSATDNAGGASSSVITTESHLGAGQTTTSKIVGASVYNTNNDKIGEVSDLILDPSGKVNSVVIGVGGFLGISERKVAIAYSSIKFGTDNKGYEHLTLAATKDQLKALTPYEASKTGG